MSTNYYVLGDRSHIGKSFAAGREPSGGFRSGWIWAVDPRTFTCEEYYKSDILKHCENCSCVAAPCSECGEKPCLFESETGRLFCWSCMKRLIDSCSEV